MEDRLKGLKKAMNNQTFRQVKFTDAHRQTINQQIAQLEEDLASSILPLLKQSKTGYELTQLLHVRGTKSIIHNEGAVYTILHEQEQLGILESYWSENEEKYYRLTKKGLKLLQKQQQKQGAANPLKNLLNEVTIHGN